MQTARGEIRQREIQVVVPLHVVAVVQLVEARYEIEVPERCAPRDLEAHGLEVSSTRKGFVRLLTQEVEINSSGQCKERW